MTESERDALRTIDCDKHTKLAEHKTIALRGFICVLIAYLTIRVYNG